MRPFFMSYGRGEDRGQAALLPSALEDYMTADGPVRVIDAFVEGLDVSGLGFGRTVPAGAGRPPYDPRDLLKLCVYGRHQPKLLGHAFPFAFGPRSVRRRQVNLKSWRWFLKLAME